jgi:drug/metabolite transporter (DMT)-like permease
VNKHPPLSFAVLLIMCAGVLLASQDGSARYLSMIYPLVMVIWARYVAQSSLMFLLFAPRMGGRIFRTQRPWLQVLRGLTLVAVSLLFIGGLAFIPLAEATAVIFLSPLMLTLYSALTGERISRGQWISLAFSLFGVLVIVRPGSELFTPAILLPVLAAASYAAYQLITRKLSNTDHGVTSNFLSSLVGTLVLSLPVPFFWETPTPGMALKMLGLGALGMVAHLLLTQALRIASAASLAPFTYLNIVFAGLVGWLLFDQVPDPVAMLGMGIIIASGVGFALVSRRAQP